MRNYDQHGANLDNSDQYVWINFGENNTFHRISNAYLQWEITISKADNTDFILAILLDCEIPLLHIVLMNLN